MVYASLNIAVRRQLDDHTARKFSIDDVGMALDEAGKFLQGELGVLENITSLSAVANQRQYAVPSTVQKLTGLWYQDANTRFQVYAEAEDRFLLESRQPITATIPRIYMVRESEKTLHLAPMPDTAANTTTLTGSHSSTVTTFTVGNNANFPTEGRGIVQSEVFRWTGKSGTTSLTGVVRGIEGTTAVTHADGTTVTERDLHLYSQRLYLDREMRTYYVTGTVTTTNGSAVVTGSSTAWTNNIGVGDFFGVVGTATGVNTTTTDALVWYEISTIDSATQITLTSNFNEVAVSAYNYIVSDPNPFPSYLDAVLKAYALSLLLKKEGQFDRSRIEWATVERFLNNARKNRQKPDREIISGSLGGSLRGGRRMAITMSGNRIW